MRLRGKEERATVPLAVSSHAPPLTTACTPSLPSSRRSLSHGWQRRRKREGQFRRACSLPSLRFPSRLDYSGLTSPSQLSLPSITAVVSSQDSIVGFSAAGRLLREPSGHPCSVCSPGHPLSPPPPAAEAASPALSRERRWVSSGGSCGSVKAFRPSYVYYGAPPKSTPSKAIY